MTDSIRLAGPLLNDAQRRHLAVTLDSLDQALLAVMQAGAAPVQAGLLRQRADDVPAGIRSGLTARASQARASLADGVMLLGLERTVQSTQGYLSAQLTWAAVLLADARAEAMVAYGEVHPRLAAALDPWLAAMADRLADMLATLKTRSGDAATH